MFFNKVGVVKYFTNFTGKHQETSTQVFSCEICEIFNNIFFYRTPPVAALDSTQLYKKGDSGSCFSVSFAKCYWTAFIKSCSENLQKIHWKTSEAESYFNKVAGVQPANLLK